MSLTSRALIRYTREMDPIKTCPLELDGVWVRQNTSGDNSGMELSLEGISQVEKESVCCSVSGGICCWFWLACSFFFSISFLILLYKRRLKSRFLCVNFPTFVMRAGASHGTELAVLWLLARIVSSDLETSCLNELVL